MKTMLLTLTFVAATAWISGEAMAQPGKKRGGQGGVQEGQNGPGAGGQRGQRGGRQAGAGQGQMPSPEQMAVRMIQNFDTDGDDKLDAQELAQMMMALRSQQGQGGQRGPGARGNNQGAKQGAGRGAQGRNRGTGKGNGGQGGGQKPNRPGG